MKEQANAPSKIKELGERVKDWRLTVPLLIALFGLTTTGVAIHTGINSNNYVKQEIPSYQPEKYKDAQWTIIDFNKRNESLILGGSKTIEVPKDISKAVNFVTENKESFEKGKKMAFVLKGISVDSAIVGALVGTIGILLAKWRYGKIKRESSS